MADVLRSELGDGGLGDVARQPQTAESLDSGDGEGTTGDLTGQSNPCCRLCGESVEVGVNGVRPCCCTGSNLYVHSACLQQQRMREGPRSFRFWECEECGASYHMKAGRHWLRALTWWPVEVVFGILSALCLFRVAADIFQLILPFILDSAKTDPDEPPLGLEWVVHGYNLGYWAGGLVLLTLLSQAINESWAETLSTALFIAPGARACASAELRAKITWDMRLCVAWVAIMYAVYAIGIAFRSSAAILRACLSMLAGERVIDFIGVPSDLVASSVESSGDQSLGTCLCCFDKSVKYVMRGCKHPIACAMCAKRLVYHEIKRSSTRPQVARMRELTTKHVEQTAISCPLCRQPDVMVAVSGNRISI